ncbi:MAG: PEGA domain-containing protein [Flavobacteriales bacterium]|jgi:hypothetical protein|nr:PEGA domain-containing protein [Flavobacteriales bacterium]
MKFKSLLLSSCSLLLLGSCATILNTGKQKIDFRTTPPNATVYINSEKAGNTPFFKYLKRNTKHHVKLELEGYKTFEVNLNKTFNPVVVLGSFGHRSPPLLYQPWPGEPHLY